MQPYETVNNDESVFKMPTQDRNVQEEIIIDKKGQKYIINIRDLPF